MSKKLISVVSATHKQRPFLRTWWNGLLVQLETLDLSKYSIQVCLVIDEETHEEGKDTCDELINIIYEDDPTSFPAFKHNGLSLEIVTNEVNEGGPAATTKALSMCSGDWISILDVDDYWLPGKLQKSLEFIEANNLDAVHHDIDCILPNQEYRVAAWSKTCWQEDVVTIKRLQEMNTIYTCSFLCKADLVKACPTPLEFSKKFGYLGDYPLFANIVYNGGKIGWLNENLATYRDSIGVNTTKREESIAADRLIKQWISNGCNRSDL